jgi:hypothetical protein
MPAALCPNQGDDKHIVVGSFPPWAADTEVAGRAFLLTKAIEANLTRVSGCRAFDRRR